MEPEQEVPIKSSVFSPLNKVTTVSKYLALFLFITLPFIGGYMGYVYAPEKVVEVETAMVDEKSEKLVLDSKDEIAFNYFKRVPSYEETEISKNVKQIFVDTIDQVLNYSLNKSTTTLLEHSNSIVEINNVNSDFYSSVHFQGDDKISIYLLNRNSEHSYGEDYREMVTNKKFISNILVLPSEEGKIVYLDKIEKENSLGLQTALFEYNFSTQEEIILINDTNKYTKGWWGTVDLVPVHFISETNELILVAKDEYSQNIRMVYTYNFDDQSITELELFASDGLILAPIQNYDTYEYVGVTKSGKLIIKQTKINNSTKLFYIDLTEAVLNANSHINTAARGKELPECVGYLLISPADDLLLCQEYEFVSNLDYESIKLNSKIKIFSAQSIININEQTKSLLNSEIKSTTPLFPDDKLMMKEEDFDLFKAYDLPSIPFLLFDVPIAWLEDNRFLEVEQVSDLENSFNINKVLLYVSNLKEEKVLIDSGPINTEFKFIGGSR